MTKKQEKEVRNSEVCLGCNGKKQKGCLVCWNCWKRASIVDTRNPFKWSGLSFEDWCSLSPEN